MANNATEAGKLARLERPREHESRRGVQRRGAPHREVQGQTALSVPVSLGGGAMFNRIASRYDRLNRMMSLGLDRIWRSRTVKLLGLSDNARVLDLATGTADLAITTAKHHKKATVYGLDPASEMLAIGREKIAKEHLAERVCLLEGDAQDLPFRDGSFDAVTIAFGIRNVPDRRLAIREMKRVLKPGGKVAILELSEAKTGLGALLSLPYVRLVVPTLGRLFSSSREYRYLQESMHAFPAPASFRSVLEEEGLRVLGIHRYALGNCHLFLAEQNKTN